jgi:cell envelope opacity-associated protein A
MAEQKMAEQKAAAPKEEITETPDEIVTRIEQNVAAMHLATPSGTASLQAAITKDLESLRSTAPPPEPPVARKAKADEDEDDDEEDDGKGKGRGKAKGR